MEGYSSAKWNTSVEGALKNIGDQAQIEEAVFACGIDPQHKG
jgi:hypothetical protein